jgi:hypothetical protein
MIPFESWDNNSMFRSISSLERACSESQHISKEGLTRISRFV